MNRKMLITILALAASAFYCAAYATEGAPAEAAAAAPAAAEVSAEMFTINNIWILISAFLVFAMHPGFALLESGLSRSKNCVNILSKNLLTVAIGLIGYCLIGFSLMYPGDAWVLGGKLLGFSGLGIANGADAATQGITYNGGLYSYFTDFLFQGMFAATCATIVSGAVAGRTKLSAYLIFTAIYATFVYTIIGSWGWGGGWLADLGFHDLAGSTFVHSVGGWAALVGAIAVGPRLGKFAHGKSHAILGHNMTSATLGVFLLWFGWFGFNGGSVFSADPIMVPYVCTTTGLAAAAGILAAMATSWITQRKPDLSMMLNGCLAGLVGITAGADCVSITSSIIIGAVSGIAVVFAVYFFDRMRIDDPVGALSVHLVCGVWGTLAVGIFSAEYSFLTQLIGVLAVATASLATSSIIFLTLKHTIGLRVSDREQELGLDVSEHGSEAYHGFQIFNTL